MNRFGETAREMEKAKKFADRYNLPLVTAVQGVTTEQAAEVVEKFKKDYPQLTKIMERELPKSFIWPVSSYDYSAAEFRIITSMEKKES